MRNIFLVILSILLFGCNQTDEKSLLNVEDFSKKISNGNFYLLDVRTPEEFSEGFIANSVNIDFNSADFDQTCMSQLEDMEKPVYVYCLSGGRSANAASALKDMGFKHVYDLDGGIKAWKNANKPIITPEKTVVENPVPAQNNSNEGDDAEKFDELIKGKKLVMVDFNATWCKPCKMMEPDVIKIKNEEKQYVEVLSIDVDKHPDIAQKYGVTAMPTLIYFKKNKVVDQSVGLQSYDELMAMVKKHR